MDTVRAHFDFFCVLFVLHFTHLSEVKAEQIQIQLSIWRPNARTVDVRHLALSLPEQRGYNRVIIPSKLEP